MCNRERPVRAGVPDLMLNPPPEVTREAAGLERFAHEMRRDGWDRDRVLNLPYEDSGYWWAQRRSMERLLETTPFAAGQTILDIGANTCWASATFARRGMRAVALDIATVEMQGLHTAEWWFEAEGMYFERVLAEMSALPFADNSFDWVFCCEVLHHKDRCGMLATLREAHRILRPGGSLLVMNEPLRWPTDLKRDHAVEVTQFEGNEHVYFVVEYLALARLAGFRRPRAHEPAYDQFYSSEPLHLTLGAGVGGSLKACPPQHRPTDLSPAPQPHVAPVPAWAGRGAPDGLRQGASVKAARQGASTPSVGEHLNHADLERPVLATQARPATRRRACCRAGSGLCARGVGDRCVPCTAPTSGLAATRARQAGRDRQCTRMSHKHRKNMDDRKSMHDTPRLANTGQSGISDGRTEMGDCPTLRQDRT